MSLGRKSQRPPARSHTGAGCGESAEDARSWKAIRRPSFREPAPLVARWRRRTVAKDDSITFPVRRWSQGMEQ